MRCFDRRVLVSLSAVAVAVLLVRPTLFGTVAPLLVVLACPLSMLFMMRRSTGASDNGPAPAPARSLELDELRREVSRLRAEVHARRAADDV